MAVSDDHLQGIAAIFDMDGTLTDNTPYHFKAWQQLFKAHHLPELTKETYLSQISGVPVQNTLQTFFGDLDNTVIEFIKNQKRRFYEELFLPHLKPVNGLENFLSELKSVGVKISLATSSDVSDVDFIFHTIPIRQHFDVLITGGMVTQPKPSPQIFLKAAEQLNTEPGRCIVFEDSLAGLKAGRAAGMKVVGITTAHPAGTLAPLADLVISDYAELGPHQLAKLFE